MAAHPSSRTVKVMVVGDNSVDKGLLLAKFEDSEHRDFPFVSTIGIPFRVREVRVEGQMMRLQLWDVGWAEAWAALTTAPAPHHSLPRLPSAFLLVYDVTREDTFESIRTWLQRVRAAGRGADWVMVILGDNCHYKHDDRQVTWERGKQLGREFRLPFFEVSSITAANLENSLKFVAGTVLAKESMADPSTSKKGLCSIQ